MFQWLYRLRLFERFALRLLEVSRHAVHERLRRSLRSCGANLSLYPPVVIENPEQVEIGDDVSLAAFVHIWGGGGVRIGDRVMIGAHVSITSLTHDPDCPDMRNTLIKEPVAIEDDVWIGCNAVILSGRTIGRGAVVGAGAVITRDVQAGEIVAGVPARRLATRAAQMECVESEEP